jgi:hypothetical protein
MGRTDVTRTSASFLQLIVIATKEVTALAGSGSLAYTDGVGMSASFSSPCQVAYPPDGSTIAVGDVLGHYVRLILVDTKDTQRQAYRDPFVDTPKSSV